MLSALCDSDLSHSLPLSRSPSSSPPPLPLPSLSPAPSLPPQHVFIPVLPSSLIDFVCSPLPYIIGINPSCIKQIETMETMEEALIVDLEKKKFVRKVGLMDAAM